MDRKEFCQHCTLLCLGGLTGLAFLPACTHTAYINSRYKPDPKRLEVPKKKLAEYRYAVIRSFELPAPVYLNHQNGVYTASLMICTHKQCEVTPYGKILKCPCHGSTYSPKGNVLEGPAKNDLKNFKTESDEKNVYIYL